MAALVAVLLLAPAAHAGRVPGFGVLGTGTNGPGAGQIGNNPRGISVNTTGAGGAAVGDVYVSDSTNNRVVQFSGSGTFIRAFGFDTVSSGPDNVTPTSEVQSVNVPSSVTGGTFTLTYNGQTTSALAFDATAASVQTALRALSSIGATGVNVTGGPGATAAYTITFAGPLANSPVPQFTVDSAGLTGDVATVSTTTQGISAFEICNPTDVCKAGTSSSLAGGLAGAQGLAVDSATGNVFVVSDTSKRVNIYAATGQFQGAFGWSVKGTSPEAKLQFCTFASACRAGTSGAGAGQFGTMTGQAQSGSSPAISPLNGHLFVPQPGNRRIDEFSFALSGGEVTDASFVKAFGGDVVPTINERQTVTLSGATGGTFALSLDGSSTDATGTGDIEAGSNEITNFDASAGAFVAGEVVSGPGIPAGARITATTFDSLTLNAPATATSEGAGLAASLPFDAAAATVQGALRGLSTIGPGNATVTGVNGGPYTVEFTGALAGLDVAQVTGDASSLTGTTPSIAVVTTQPGANGAGTGFETCTAATGCKAGSGKEEAGIPVPEVGTFVASTPTSVAVDSTGSVYAVGQPAECASSGLACGVQKYNASATTVEWFAPLELASPGQLGPVAASRLVSVDPSNDRVLVAKKVSNFTFKIFEFTRTGSFIDSSPPGEDGVPANGVSGNNAGPQGMTVGTGGRAYSLLQTLSSAPVVPGRILGLPPAPSATVDSPGVVTQTTATFSGVAQPSAPGSEGGFATVAYFEYSTDGVSWIKTPPVEIGTGTGAGDPNQCPTGNPPRCNVTRVVGGLKAGTAYLVRMVADNGTKTTSVTSTFTTATAPPGIRALGSEEVSDSAATLTGLIDPNGKSTSYHFEWGPTTDYGTRVPADFEAVAGSGSEPVSVSIEIAGLQPASTYHFRIVAKSSAGETISADKEVVTLNAAGLPNDRRAELVSPANKRPVGLVQGYFPYQQFFRAAEAGGAIAYPIQNALEDSTASGTLVYQASRTDAGWSSTQITPANLIPAPVADQLTARSGVVRAFSSNLRCALVETHNPLTSDTPQIDIENGVYNLYLWNAEEKKYTLITQQPPLNPAAIEPNATYYEVAGVTPDCTKVFFRSTTYNFIPGGTGIYEWSSGTLRDAGSHGSVAPGSVGQTIARDRYTVSDNGRLFFQATSNDSGKQAVFVRQSPTETVDASQSTTATVTLGAQYEAASPDGSHVFFLANYGLASTTSNGPADNCSSVSTLGTAACDLYDYDVEAGTLTDVSADVNPADPRGAVVQGVVDVSDDGETVYFAARGQLIPGEGRAYSQNLLGGGFANLYRYHRGELSYVGSLDAFSLNRLSLVRGRDTWTAQTTKDGNYLLFTSRDEITDPNPQNISQAYLYSSATGETECVSCPSGRSPEATAVLADQFGNQGAAGNYTPRSLSEDGRVFFTSADTLTPGAIRGEEGIGAKTNLYEWRGGQLSLLSSGRLEMVGIGGDDARDVYVRTSEQLVPEDVDFASDLYDLRSGGGFVPPPPPPVPCTGDACQGAPQSPPSSPTASSVTFDGDGNARPLLKPRVSKLKAVKGASAILTIRLPVRGVLTVSGSGLNTTRRSVATAGTVRLKVVLTGRARTRLQKKKRLRITAKVVYRPRGGTSSTANVSLTFKATSSRKKKGRKMFVKKGGDATLKHHRNGPVGQARDNRGGIK